MTLQKAKEEIARCYGYNSWDDFNTDCVNNNYVLLMSKYSDYVAKIYAQSAREKAIDECISIVKGNVKNISHASKTVNQLLTLKEKKI